MRLSKVAGAVVALLTVSQLSYAASSSVDVQLKQLQQEVAQLQQQITGDVGTSHSANVSQKATTYHRGAYLNIATDASEPFDRLSSTSYALDLLKEKNDFANDKLVLGGYLEADAQAWGGGYDQAVTGARYHSGTGIYLTTAKLYSVANLNSWTTVLLDLDTDFTSSTQPGIERGFITIGNLNKAPMYLTVGKLHLSNGIYGGGGAWANALQHTAFRPGTTDQIELGYFKNGLATTFELFNSGGADDASANDFVMAMHYSHKDGGWTYGAGAGYLHDIRGTSSSVGSAYSNSNGQLSGKRNSLWDVNGHVSYGEFGLSGEYNITSRGATRLANTNGRVPADQTTGKMSAYMLAGTYTPKIWGKPTAFTLSYSGTNNMASVPMGLAGHAVTSVSAPTGFQSEWIVAASREVLDNVYLSPEWAWARTYNGTGDTWEATLDMSAYF